MKVLSTFAYSTILAGTALVVACDTPTETEGGIEEGTETQSLAVGYRRPGPVIPATSYDQASQVTASSDGVRPLSPGAWTAYQGVFFGSSCDVASVKLEVQWPTGGQLEVRLDAPTGRLIASVSIAPASSVQTISASLGVVSGPHDVYLVYKPTDCLCVASYVKSLQFVTGEARCDLLPPSQPINFGTHPGCANNSIYLNWRASDNVGVVGYNVTNNGVRTYVAGETLLYSAGFTSRTTPITISATALDARGHESAPLCWNFNPSDCSQSFGCR